MLDSWLSAVRDAMRGLSRHRLFALASVLTIALAIGANVAVFSVVESVVLRPLPFPEPAELVMLPLQDRARQNNGLVHRHDIGELKALAPETFEAVEGMRNGLVDMVLEGTETPISARGELVTPGVFSLLGVHPVLGRGFENRPAPSVPEADGEEAPPGRALIAHGLWEQAFGADPNVLGRLYTVNGSPVVIEGVMPPRFAIPRLGRSARGYDVDMWLAIDDLTAAPRTNTRTMQGLARLAEGVTPEQARQALGPFNARLRQEVPVYGEREWGIGILSLHDEISRPVRTELTVLMAAVGLLLLLACGNVSCLLLARGRQRSRETAVMIALGCPQRRLIGHRFVESVAISMFGGALGIALGYAGAVVLEKLRPVDLPAVSHASVDWLVAGYAVAATALATLLFGVFPAVADSRFRSGLLMGRAGIGGSGRGTRKAIKALVVFETAGSVTLLVGALLLVRTVIGIYQERPGFDLHHTLAFELRLDYTHPAPEEREAVVRRVREAVAAIPGVDAVGATNVLPYSGGLWNGTVTWDDPGSPTGISDPQLTEYRLVTPGFFEAMGTPFLAGRDFFEREDRTSTIIDEVFARRAWPGGDPIGKVLRPAASGGLELVVVGVVGHIRELQPHVDGRPILYVSDDFRPAPELAFVVHAPVLFESLPGAIRRAVRTVDPQLLPYRMAPMAEGVRASVSGTRYVMLLLSGFSVVALALAAVGLYGILAYGVRLRLPELGVRVALGATRLRIFSGVVAEAMALAGLGLALGWVLAIGLRGYVDTLLFGITATDPATYLATGALVIGVAALAGGLPARRACTVDPNQILKAD